MVGAVFRTMEGCEHMVKFHTESLLSRLFLLLSGVACTVLLMMTESKLSFAVTGLLAVLLLSIFISRTGFLSRLFVETHWGLCLTAGILALAEVYRAKSTFYTTCGGWLWKLFGFLHLPGGLIRFIPWLLALMALPMLFGYLCWFVRFFWKHTVDFWNTSDFCERMYLLSAGIIFAILIFITYSCTQAFYGAHVNGAWYNFDLIYSADSGYLVHTDVFRNIGADQNDLRQPLFGVFAMPFAQAAWLISKILFFLPNGYVTVLQVMEMLLFLVSTVLIARMLGLTGYRKALFLGILCVSYPVLIFSLTAEQYLFAVFYLVLMIYLMDDPLGGSLGYVAATGSMLTSGIFFPLITWDWRFRKFVRNTMKLCGIFFAVMILSGRLTTFLDIPSYIEGYGYYTGADVPLTSKLMQYVNFAGSTLAAPASHVDFESYRHVSWQMMPVTRWRLTGFLMLAAAAGGIAVKPKARFTKICGAWIAFSFLLLGIVGWGTIDNGLMLYSLYFGWAFIAMAFQLGDFLLSRWPVVEIAAVLLLMLFVGLKNVTALKAALVFATQFFPALR